VLRDFRDGTNLAGVNPNEEKRIRHIGFSGHFSAPVMMEMIRRDAGNLLDAVLVAVNANDRRYLNMQHNLLPVAEAKGMGVIAMKVFADGAMYSKGAHWSRSPGDVVQSVGAPGLPSAPFVRYALAAKGVHTAIIGTGHVDRNPRLCQLENNLAAAQILPSGLSPSDRAGIEEAAASVKKGGTNYFQKAHEPLSPASDPRASNARIGERRIVRLAWNTAYAGSDPIHRYDVVRDGRTVASVPHRPQTGPSPFSYEDDPADLSGHEYAVVTVDASGSTARTGVMVVPSAE
jgi:hypothetical protein